jgi:hypothetical protein
VFRRQDGQTVPLLMMIMLSLLAFGVLFFQVGRASIFSTEAQTAADAAALGAVQDIKAQLTAQVAATGTSSLSALDPQRIRAAAERYARKNKGHVTQLERRGVDVKVWTDTLEALGRDARKVDAEKVHGSGRARARIDVLAIAQPVAGGGNIGSSGGAGIERIKGSEWKDLEKDIDKPPACGSDAKSNDLVKLGRLLREHGFAVAENAEMGDDPKPKVHAEGGFHYKCRHSGALDVNADNGPGSEKQIIDGIVREVQELGFRTIWQAAGHFDHIHIDLANSGAIGVGGSDGGAVGALEETGLDVKLIDWDAAYTPFGGFGGLYAGGTYGGPPNMKIAAIICDVLDKYADKGAGPRVRLSAFEAAIVESGVHNLTYGDRDSLGVFQQRPSMVYWGTAAQIMDPVHAADIYIRTAIARQNLPDVRYGTAGQLAQKVQGSAYPLRYDQVQMQALALMEKACG